MTMYIQTEPTGSLGQEQFHKFYQTIMEKCDSDFHGCDGVLEKKKKKDGANELRIYNESLYNVTFCLHDLILIPGKR